MIHELQIRTSPREAYDERGIIAFLQREKGLRADAVQVLKRSIDARQRTIYVNLTVRAFIGEKPKGQDFDPIIYPDVSDRPSVIVVGAGPGGLFAALRLIELGLRPIVVERGKDVRERKKDLARIRPEQKMPRAIIPLAKEEQELIVMANYSPEARSVAIATRYCASSFNMVPIPISWLMLIPISAPIVCHV